MFKAFTHPSLTVIEYDEWLLQWYDEDTRCRFDHCRYTVTSKNPRKRRQHILQHLTRAICGVCFEVRQSIDGMVRHNRRNHHNNKCGVDHCEGGKFIVARDRLRVFTNFFRTRGLMNETQEKRINDRFINIPLVTDEDTPNSILGVEDVNVGLHHIVDD